MATAAGRRLTEAHRIAQGRIAARTADLLMPVWRILDIADIDRTAPGWAATAATTIAQQRQVSVQTAAAYLTAFRAVELGKTAEPFTLPPAPPLDQSAAMVSLLVTGPWNLKAKIGRGMPLPKALEQSFAASTEAGIRHSLNGGRSLVTATREADPRATGYVRVTSGTACKFCKDVAEGSETNPGLSGEFECHDGCNCHPELTYG
jgi:hypothetical protein